MALADILSSQGEAATFQIPSGQIFTPLYADGTVYTRPSGTVVSDAGNSSTQFDTDFSGRVTDCFKGCLVVFVTGTLKDQVQKISAFNGSTNIITVASAFTGTPSVGDKFVIVGF